jgi:hypothetical protein
MAQMITYFVRIACKWIRVTTTITIWSSLPHVIAMTGCVVVMSTVPFMHAANPIASAGSVAPTVPTVPGLPGPITDFLPGFSTPDAGAIGRSVGAHQSASADPDPTQVIGLPVFPLDQPVTVATVSPTVPPVAPSDVVEPMSLLLLASAIGILMTIRFHIRPNHVPHN